MSNTYFTEEIVQGDNRVAKKKAESHSYLLEILKKLVKFISFIDLPIKKKFILFSLGVMFWFVVMFGANVVTNMLINDRLERVTSQIVPADRVTQKINRKIQGLIIDSTAIQTLTDNHLLNTRIDSSRAKIIDVQAFLNTMIHGGKVVDITREDNQFVESIHMEPVTNFPDAVKYVNELTALIEESKSTLEEIIKIKIGVGESDEQTTSPLLNSMDEYGKILSEAYKVSMQFPPVFAAYYNASSTEIKRGTKITLYVMIGIMIISSALLFIFTTTITRSISVPVQSMMEQIKSISAGKIDLSKKIHIRSKDEIGKLTEDFNFLTREIFDIVTFKKVIEEDDNLEDVYARLGKSFREKCDIEEFTIYEVSSSTGKMKPVYPLILNEKEISCTEDILDNCELCKVKKTGHAISSVGYPEVCRQFRPDLNKVHLCIPMIVGGKTGGVVQFLFESDKAISENSRRLFKAEQYIKESLSVIEAKRLMNTLRESALKDPLTGLYNRRFLQEYTETLVGGTVRRDKSIGLIMCDLDFFKQVNDYHGHNVGDAVLKETADIIKNCLRSSDLMIRFGGEEFLVLVIDVNKGETLKIAEKIRETVEKNKIKIPEGSIKKTISLGISEFPNDAETFWQAIKFADVALYKAKETGRNKSVKFTEDMWTDKSF